MNHIVTIHNYQLRKSKNKKKVFMLVKTLVKNRAFFFASFFWFASFHIYKFETVESINVYNVYYCLYSYTL